MSVSGVGAGAGESERVAHSLSLFLALCGPRHHVLPQTPPYGTLSQPMPAPASQHADLMEEQVSVAERRREQEEDRGRERERERTH